MKNKPVLKFIKIISLLIAAIGLLILIFHKSEEQIIEEIRELATVDSAQFRNVADYMYAIRDTFNKDEVGCNYISVFPNNHSMYLSTENSGFIKLNNGFDRYDFLVARKILHVAQCDFYVKFNLAKYGGSDFEDAVTTYKLYFSRIPLNKQYISDVYFFEKVGDNLYIVVKKTAPIEDL